MAELRDMHYEICICLHSVSYEFCVVIRGNAKKKLANLLSEKETKLKITIV